MKANRLRGFMAEWWLNDGPNPARFSDFPVHRPLVILGANGGGICGQSLAPCLLDVPVRPGSTRYPQAITGRESMHGRGSHVAISLSFPGRAGAVSKAPSCAKAAPAASGAS